MTDNERIRWQRKVDELEQMLKIWMAMTALSLMFLIVSLIRGMISP